ASAGCGERGSPAGCRRRLYVGLRSVARRRVFVAPRSVVAALLGQLVVVARRAAGSTGRPSPTATTSADPEAGPNVRAMSPKQPAKQKRAQQNRNQRAARAARSANANAAPTSAASSGGSSSAGGGGSLLSRLRGGGSTGA